MKTSDVDVERAVLGCMLSFQICADKILLIDSGDFDFSIHVKIYEAMKANFDKCGKFDFITIGSNLDADTKTEMVNCVNVAVSAGLFDEHFKILKEMASARRIVSKFNSLQLNGDVSVSTLQNLLDNEAENRLITNIEEVNEENINQFVGGLNKSKGALKTGFGTIDKTIGGIRKGTVFIIGARPSTGKTTFALNIAANQIGKDKKTMLFSLEMSSEMIYERLMAAKHKIKYDKFSLNSLTDSEIELITKDTDKLKQDNNFIVIDDVYNAEYICNMITENKPNLAVVDFVQIISTTAKFENPRNKIDYISNLFKRTAKSTGCVILVLSQLSRAGKEAPTMSDLKESGGLEQDGDYIALLHRPFVLNKSDDNITPEHAELLLDKNKFGRTGKVDLHFDLKHQKFYEIDSWRESQIDRGGLPFESDIEI